MADETTQQTSQSSTGGASQQSSGAGAEAHASGTSQNSSQGSSQSSQQQTQQSQQTQGGGAGATKVDRPAYVPEQFWDPTAGKVKDEFAGKVTAWMTTEAAEQVRKSALPQKAEDYKYDLPSDFQAPQDMGQFQFDPADKSLEGFRNLAHEAGLSQETFSKALGLLAANKVAEAQVYKNAREAEIGKLGATGPQRMSAINTFLEGSLGKDVAKPLQDSIWTAAAVKSWEAFITKITSGHGSNFSQANRTEKTGVDDATYNSWSPQQRMNYARTGDPSKAAA